MPWPSHLHDHVNPQSDAVEPRLREWIGGLFKPRPAGDRADDVEIAVWLEDDGGLLSATIRAPHQTPVEALQEALIYAEVATIARRRAWDDAPIALRVSDESLAGALLTPHIVKVGETRELELVRDRLEDVALDLAEQLALDPFRHVSRFDASLFFHRARTFVDARPWEAIPIGLPIGIDLPRYGVFGACVFLWGDPSLHGGVMFFPTYAAYDAFATQSSYRIRRGLPHSDDLGAPFACLDFFAAEELHPALVKRFEHQLFRSGRGGKYPIPTIVELGGERRELNADDLTVFEGVFAALTELALFHAHELHERNAVQVLVETDDLPPAVVECPHPEWVPPGDDDEDELVALRELLVEGA